MPNQIKVTYVTSSKFKQDENKVFLDHAVLTDGTPVKDLFTFEIRAVPISEMLEVDLQVLVQEEVVKAYSQIRVPCIVEHAGLIFDDYKDKSYPGGLTKPMWNTLGDKFLEETQSKGRKAIARAVIAYCDGMSVKTFVGESVGRLADAPRGKRQFYWDTVFIPDEASGAATGLTYAEIVEEPTLGLEYKITKLSQSGKAMRAFLEYLRSASAPSLWGHPIT
jgi:inosine/xanthosine triphosphate pyrophosphatase family protein